MKHRSTTSSAASGRSHHQPAAHKPLVPALALGILCLTVTSAGFAQSDRLTLQPTSPAQLTPDRLAQEWLVSLNPELVESNPAQMQIDLPDGTSVTATREAWYQDSISATWKGRVVGAPEELSMVLLTVADSHVAGVIETEEAQYAVSPRPGAHSVERSTTARGECDGGVVPPADLVGTPQALAGDGLVGVEQEAGSPVVRILVLFTPSGAGVVGGGINAAAASAVAYLNASIDNARVSGSARLAAAEVIETLDGSTGLDSFLTRLRLDPTVAARRAATSADIVQLFVGFTEANGGCGLGYVMGRNGTSRNMAPWAFGASSIRCEPDSTFAHEVGHNLGLNHNPEDSDFGNPFHSWSYGHRYAGANAKTVMSYGPHRTMPYFSNPAVTTAGGFTTGIANERDNARTLGTTMSIASGFVGSAQTATVPRPTGLSAELVSASSAQLNWSDPASDETGFRIEQRVNGASWRLATTVEANVTSTLIEPLDPGSEIRFRVRTIRGSQTSDPSNVATVQTSAAARAPLTLSAVPLSDTEIELAWQAAESPGTSTAQLLIEGRSVNHEYLPMGELLQFSDASDGSYVVSGLTAETAYTFRTRIAAAGEADPGSIGSTASATTGGYSGPCRDDGGSLCLLTGRFEVRVAWRSHIVENDIGTATAIPIAGSQESGMFWFFQPENIELVVKVLDGTGITGTYWQFYGALSDVEYWVSTRDTSNGNTRTYHNPPGNLCGVGDILAFPGDVPPDAATVVSDDGLGTAMRAVSLDLPLPEQSTQDVEPNAGTCVPDSNTLCFADGRFAVSVDYTVTQPTFETGSGTTLPSLGTNDTGFFWFFNQSNVELAVKILDGRVFNDRFWLFYGALSDVEYTLTVTDTTGGPSMVINNAAGNLCGDADTLTLGAPIN